MSAAVGLIALALGYFAYVRALKEKKGLRILGQVIGVVVMLGAVLSLVCAAMRCPKMHGGCPFKSKGMCSMRLHADSDDTSSQVGIP
jgi:hypothetical protein